MLARTRSEAAGLTIGASLNALTLVEAIGQNLPVGGFFDGQGLTGPITVPAGGSAYQLDGQTVRATLAQAMLQFVASSRNASSLKQADALAIANAIANDQDPYLFRPGGGPVDVTPPDVKFVLPLARGGLARRHQHSST